ncbi:MAG: ABC transporter permease, partial [Candidatus Thorarchaeota archaeon]
EPTQDMFAGIMRGAFGDTYEDSYNYMITDWGLSINDMLDKTSGIANQTARAIRNTLLLTIDRTDLIDPYDIQGSMDRIGVIQSKIESRLSGYDVYVSNLLVVPLIMFMFTSIMMNAVFMMLSLPIFFMAYFTGTMVSDVGYNLRRREIGLLLTKGYKRGTIRNMFLIEGVIVGALAGALSVFIGTGAAWFALDIEGLDFFTALSNNVTSIYLTIIVGMILALLSVYRPANRASKLEIIDALKQYVLIEETSEYKNLLPNIAFILGTYKIIVWIIGVDMNLLLPRLLGGNMTLSIVVGVWLGIDSIMNIVGPLAFLYGSTKIFIRKSDRFHEAIVKAGHRFFGAFGTLATRNVKRNPTRNAAMVFILALIVSYGVFAVGSLFSEYDRVERGALFSVGSDVSLQLDNSINMTEMDDMISDIVANENVESATVEYDLNLYTGSTTIEVRGIRPNEWLSSAFWEPGWFIGDISEMMENLDEDGIILSVTLASELDLAVGDSILVNDAFDVETHELEIVGIIGYRSIVSDFLEEMGINQAGSYPSFVSESFLDESELLATATSNVLVKTGLNVNGTALQETFLEQFGDDLDSSFSVTTYMDDYWERPIQSGVTKIQWVAIAFAVVLAIVITSLVIILTLREKEVEIALITVRGFSKWQLFKTLMAEMLIMVVFALILGTFVGLVQIFGNASGLNGGLTELIRYQVVLGGVAGSTILLIIGVVLLAATIPIYMASRRPEAKVDSLRA